MTQRNNKKYRLSIASCRLKIKTANSNDTKIPTTHTDLTLCIVYTHTHTLGPYPYHGKNLNKTPQNIKNHRISLKKNPYSDNRAALPGKPLLLRPF